MTTNTPAVEERPLSKAEERRAFAELGAEETDGFEEPEPDEEAAEPEQEASDGPAWATAVPPQLKIPVGVQVTWIRILAKWTYTPSKGDRILLCWPLNEVEEGQAVDRGRGKQHLVTNELAKGCVRLVDGHLADRTGTPGRAGSLASLWRELGPKGRHIMRTYYARAHSMSEDEVLSFFSTCIDSRTAAPA